MFEDQEARELWKAGPSGLDLQVAHAMTRRSVTSWRCCRRTSLSGPPHLVPPVSVEREDAPDPAPRVRSVTSAELEAGRREVDAQLLGSFHLSARHADGGEELLGQRLESPLERSDRRGGLDVLRRLRSTGRPRLGVMNTSSSDSSEPIVKTSSPGTCTTSAVSTSTVWPSFDRDERPGGIETSGSSGDRGTGSPVAPRCADREAPRAAS